MNKLIIIIGVLLYPNYLISQIKLTEFNWNGGITHEITSLQTNNTSLLEFDNKFTIGSYASINTRISYKENLSCSFGLFIPSIGYKGQYKKGWEHTTKDVYYLGYGFNIDYLIFKKPKYHINSGIGLIMSPNRNFGTSKSIIRSNYSNIISQFETFSFQNRGFVLSANTVLSKKLLKNIYFNCGLHGGVGLKKLFATKFTYYFSEQDYINGKGHSQTIVTKGDFIACFIGIQYHINKVLIK
ncbi:MAG: hypothetical protein ACOYLP_10395 [Flavobacterium sp.]|uniref:hypothetical protein n=1 Tax=Flavobacterium sp. TaxID=239 RepID=UPI003BC44C7F